MTIEEHFSGIRDRTRRVEDAASDAVKALVEATKNPSDESRDAFYKALKSFDIWSSVLRGAKLDFERSRNN